MVVLSPTVPSISIDKLAQAASSQQPKGSFVYTVTVYRAQVHTYPVHSHLAEARRPGELQACMCAGVQACRRMYYYHSLPSTGGIPQHLGGSQVRERALLLRAPTSFDARAQGYGGAGVCKVQGPILNPRKHASMNHFSLACLFACLVLLEVQDPVLDVELTALITRPRRIVLTRADANPPNPGLVWPKLLGRQREASGPSLKPHASCN